MVVEQRELSFIVREYLTGGGGTDLILDWGTKIPHAMGRAKQTQQQKQTNKQTKPTPNHSLLP